MLFNPSQYPFHLLSMRGDCSAPVSARTQLPTLILILYRNQFLLDTSDTNFYYFSKSTLYGRSVVFSSTTLWLLNKYIRIKRHSFWHQMALESSRSPWGYYYHFPKSTPHWRSIVFSPTASWVLTKYIFIKWHSYWYQTALKSSL